MKTLSLAYTSLREIVSGTNREAQSRGNVTTLSDLYYATRYMRGLPWRLKVNYHSTSLYITAEGWQLVRISTHVNPVGPTAERDIICDEPWKVRLSQVLDQLALIDDLPPQLPTL
jgi:hypothetical protein